MGKSIKTVLSDIGLLTFKIKHYLHVAAVFSRDIRRSRIEDSASHYLHD